MPQAADSMGRPALTCAWRAGFWPCAAVSTWPRIVSETSVLSMPARATTASSTAAPRSWAGVVANAPPKEPTAVRAADAITTLVMEILLRDDAGAGRAVVPPRHNAIAAPRQRARPDAAARPQPVACAKPVSSQGGRTVGAPK